QPAERLFGHAAIQPGVDQIAAAAKQDVGLAYGLGVILHAVEQHDVRRSSFDMARIDRQMALELVASFAKLTARKEPIRTIEMRVGAQLAELDSQRADDALAILTGRRLARLRPRIAADERSNQHHADADPSPPRVRRTLERDF